jgi:small subunit ribosomal protein S8
MQTDPIADMLTRIRNSHRAGLKAAEMSHSKMKEEIARVLKREGYIEEYGVDGDGPKKTLRVSLKYYHGKKPCITGIRRVSTPGLRRYVPATEIPRVLGGLGIAILTTSSGILTDREARKNKVGGEVMCMVW